MKLRKRNAFTLIELIAILVIMAIIALIVTPLVMSIIRKARISADKRSIDAYGRSIELAIAGYLMDNGSFPTSIEQLTIEYTGDKVECETTQINPDSSVYLSNCKVNNRTVTNYTYGTDKMPNYEVYNVGDEVTYNGVDYYVLKDSGAKDNVVTLLKATPLTTEEVNLYGGVGTEDNHVNRYITHYPGTQSDGALDKNGYGDMAYYNTQDCSYVRTNCTNDYANSNIKFVIDNWSKNSIIKEKLKQARLITKDEYESNCEEVYYIDDSGDEKARLEPQYEWLYNNQYEYWTMSVSNDSNDTVLGISSSGNFFDAVEVYKTDRNVVRPVVELYKNDGITRKNSGNN